MAGDDDIDTKQEEPDRQARINCFSCRHFFITHDRHFPYGCRAAGFRSRAMPSEEVYASSGMPCLLFDEKDKTR
ncbi:MAG: hypothetical protein A4E73_00089 [Syntrophaceae bacterium PtaU1.Bin231]|jgi:hypothetical protein|nr:MAG: hypothetical protein A4E73_00089 [Syntrophaceae bacterium PtaU1.Bin231]